MSLEISHINAVRFGIGEKSSGFSQREVVLEKLEEVRFHSDEIFSVRISFLLLLRFRKNRNKFSCFCCCAFVRFSSLADQEVLIDHDRWLFERYLSASNRFESHVENSSSFETTNELKHLSLILEKISNSIRLL